MPILKILKRGLMALALIAPQTTLAATLPEGTVSAYAPRSGGFHDIACPGCFVTAQLNLSTTDRWNTAQISYTATGGGGTSTASGFLILRHGTGASSSYTEINSGDPLQPFASSLVIPTLTDGQMTNISFTGGQSFSDARPAWDVLSNGMFISQSYFGNEFSSNAVITFNDRRISSYSFDLFGPTATPVRLTRSFGTGLDSPAPVPLPASLAGLAFGLLTLRGLRRTAA